MKNAKIMLTSIIAIATAVPAANADTYGTDANNSTGQCVVDVLNVSANNATATARATWTANTYTCSAGTYLPSGGSWQTDNQYTNNNCAPCPANSYCPGNVGGTAYTYNASNNQGITACSGTYTLSDTNASSVNQCYRNCTTSDVAHSNTVSGRYYSNETAESNSCVPATCVTGYSVVSFDPTTDLPASSASPEYESYRAKSLNGSYYGNGVDDDNLEAGDISVPLTDFSDLENGGWKISWTSGAKQGTLNGIASCNSTAGDNGNWNWNNDSSNWSRSGDTFNSSSTGQYCWCKPTSWTPSGGSAVSLSAAWVFLSDVGDAGGCADGCAFNCAYYVGDDSGFRAAVFGVVGAMSQCVANTINLNWKDETGTNTLSDPTSCTYGGTFATPATAPEKRGHTFAGWQFVNQQ